MTHAVLIARARALIGGQGIAGVLARGAIWSFVITTLGTAVALGVQILLANVIGAAQYGVYLYALGWMNVVILLGKLDFDNAAVRFIGVYNGRREWPLLRGFLRTSHRTVGVASALVAAAGALVLWSLRGRVSPALVASGWAACVLLPVMALLHLQSSCLQGFKRIAEAQAPNVLIRPALFGLLIGAAMAFRSARLDAATAILLNVASTVAALFVAARYLRRAIPAAARQAGASYAAAEWWHVALGMLVISASQLVLSQQADVVIVGTLLDTSVAGVYGAASQLSTLVQFGVSAVLFIATPMIAELHARGQRTTLQRMLTLVGRVNVAVSVPIVLGLALIGRLLLGWYGPEFEQGYAVLLILSVSQLVAAVVGSLAGFFMSMTGHQNAAAVIIAGSALLNVTLTFVLTPLFGLRGAATATLIGILSRSVMLAAYIRRRAGLTILPFGGGGPAGEADPRP